MTEQWQPSRRSWVIGAVLSLGTFAAFAGTLLNIKPPDPQKPFDNRFLSLFVQSRFGK